ncbi:HNH endonuclease [Sphingomonas faeni]|uniref:HNH endonuclease n=1 Tax=Sphingomonas faeni TaxID=185950 RepID=UPI0024134FF0|nr:HNH endonuclease signature motif containing protein [Sphingomonas faeni]
MTFNAMLRDAGIDPRDVSLLRHQTRRNGMTPHDLRSQSLVRFERYQATQQDRPVFRNPRYWASFVSPDDHETVFVGLYAVNMRRDHVIDWPDDLGATADAAAVGAGKDVPYFFWHTELKDVLRDQIGHLRIEWGDSLRSWAQHAAHNDKRIVPGTRAPTDATAHRLSVLGFTQTHATKKLTRFDRGTVTLYVKDATTRLPIVIHPYYETRLAELRTVPGVTLDTPFGYYINSNLSAFPRWRDAGRATPSRYGIDLSCDDDAASTALTAFLDANGTIPTPDGPVIIGGPPNAERTQRETLRLARIGQGRFRRDLFEIWGGRCAVSGVALPEFLRASHILAWQHAIDTERRDPYNGLLLGDHLDALFDAYLIGFDDDGRLLRSTQVGQDMLAAVGIEASIARLGAIDARHRPYLAQHRARMR